MKFQFLGLAIILSFASACAPRVVFQEYPLTEQTAEDLVDLRISSIYALSREVVFLLGGLETGSETFRSVLLRSTDGGQHWREVMQPEVGSVTTELAFLSESEGWATVIWMAGGAGPSYLYHSTDSGDHWQKISEFPASGLGASSRPARLTFLNLLQGQIWIIDTIKLIHSPDQACCRFETSDGGLTWEATTDCLPQEECLLNMPNEFNIENIGWKYGVDPSESVIKVSRRLSADANWTQVSEIPLHYRYKKGKIITP